MSLETRPPDPDFTTRPTRLELVLPSQQEDGAIDLAEILRKLWLRKWLIAAMTLLCAGASVIIAVNIPDQYRATAILAPASGSGASQLGQLGGLAAIAGVNLGGTQAQDKSVFAEELLTTWAFLEDFIRESNIEVQVFAAKRWDKATGQLVIDDELYDVVGQKWVHEGKSSGGQSAGPSGWDLYDSFRKRVSVSRDRTNNLLTLSVQHYSPVLAKEWVDKLIVSVNHHMRERDRAESQRSIDYLNQQVQKTSLNDMKTVFYELIEEQTKTLMLAEVSDEYVLKTLSPAKVPEEKSTPPRMLICAGITMLGFFIGCVAALIWGVRDRKLPVQAEG